MLPPSDCLLTMSTNTHTSIYEMMAYALPVLSRSPTLLLTPSLTMSIPTLMNASATFASVTCPQIHPSV